MWLGGFWFKFSIDFNVCLLYISKYSINLIHMKNFVERCKQSFWINSLRKELSSHKFINLFNFKYFQNSHELTQEINDIQTMVDSIQFEINNLVKEDATFEQWRNSEISYWNTLNWFEKETYLNVTESQVLERMDKMETLKRSKESLLKKKMVIEWKLK